MEGLLVKVLFSPKVQQYGVLHEAKGMLSTRVVVLAVGAHHAQFFVAGQWRLSAEDGIDRPRGGGSGGCLSFWFVASVVESNL